MTKCHCFYPILTDCDVTSDWFCGGRSQIHSFCQLDDDYVFVFQLVREEGVTGVVTMNEEYETKVFCPSHQVSKGVPMPLKMFLCLLKMFLCLLKMFLCLLKMFLCLLKMFLCLLKMFLCLLKMLLCLLKMFLCLLKMFLCLLKMLLCLLKMFLCLLKVCLCLL